VVYPVQAIDERDLSYDCSMHVLDGALVVLQHC
jgi:hypothetical protein